ncbi:MAG: acetylornithine/succinylornithine family transaminase [Acidobacteria bacterium]|nr:acetylornithine/succinylornithine family transaminase [Acidobacteriota bacterium]
MTSPLSIESGARDSQVKALEQEHLLQTYRRAPVVFRRGEGVYLYDNRGQRYLDLISGIGVVSLGHANPALAAALADQARTLIHTSNLYYHELQGQVAALLTALSGLPRVFICNSGTEAVEACLKFARRFWYTSGDRRRNGFVALEHGFHGRTIGSLSVTWDEHYRAPFEPLLGNVTWVPASDADALDAAVSSTTAAIIVEAVQGEGGIRPLSAEMAAALERSRDRTGALIIADEVQCGLGRTGSTFAYQRLGIHPDLAAVGKALGAGVSVGAALVSQPVASAISFGDHGTTYGGNLLACRAALVFLEALTSGGLQEHIREVGGQFGEGLRALAVKHPMVREVRGAGLMWGLDLKVDAAPVIDAALERGLLVNRTAGTVVRMLPPFVITSAELDQALVLLDGVLADIAREAVTS